MTGSTAALLFALVTSSLTGSACAMKQNSAESPCRISGADKLPADAGDALSVCAAIERAIAGASPGAKYSVEIHILSPYSLTALIRTPDGRPLPEQSMTMSDRKLTRASIDRFAISIGAEVAMAATR